MCERVVGAVVVAVVVVVHGENGYCSSVSAFSGVEMHATLNELLPTLSMVGKSGWAREREREREEERLLQLPFLFCLRDFLGQREAVTIKPKKKKNSSLY